MKLFHKYALLAFLVIGSLSTVSGQHPKSIPISNNFANDIAGQHSQIEVTECSGTALPNYDKAPLLINIKNLEKKHSYGKEIEIIKNQKSKNKSSEIIAAEENQLGNFSTVQTPVVGTNFQGNIFNGGAPPDNTIAIASNGNIVSVINCNVAYYNESGTRLWTGSFWELFNDPSLTQLIYDPIVMYDSQQDRFVMIALHGFSSSTSKLIISFSKSNNPLDGWWVYKLTGNPRNNSSWLDYPKLGISNNEVYVTGNLFGDGSGFSESVIYQISKSNGFAGTALNWRLWSNISGSPITIIPVSYGQNGNYGPGLYFINQSPASGNAVDLFEITNDLNANPQLIRNRIFKGDYEPSGNAQQLGTSVELITGDCRIQNAFYLNETIHYVFQSDYLNSNFTGINYNRLNVKNLSNQTFNFGQIGFDCAYPSVASYANDSTDQSVIFCYLRSGSTIFPETRTIAFNQNWSASTLVKAGTNFVDAFELDNTVRWGDYSGIAYKYNETQPEVWLSGCFGSTQNLFNTRYNCFNTWIARISNNPITTIQPSIINEATPKIFPNPAIDLFSINFKLTQTNQVEIKIFDQWGVLVCELFHGDLKNGTNQLTFNRAALPSGTYLLQITEGQKTILVEKLLLQ
jgi:hypothetical protein